MDELKNFTENFRDDFEKESLPENHKERFILKLKREQKRDVVSHKTIQFMFYFAAASIALILILTPTLYLSKVYKNRALDSSDYVGVLEKRSQTITTMAESLTPQEKAIVLSTLDQLTFEAVSFESQLPECIKDGEREILIKSYYTPRIEGVDKLEKYTCQLINN
ncbi:MAG: hypothetical protein ABFC28_10220 [Rikenellaceae bacterium]